jgi:hypothetical protein
LRRIAVIRSLFKLLKRSRNTTAKQRQFCDLGRDRFPCAAIETKILGSDGMTKYGRGAAAKAP